jgi:hypothetical protein
VTDTLQSTASSSRQPQANSRKRVAVSDETEMKAPTLVTTMCVRATPQDAVPASMRRTGAIGRFWHHMTATIPDRANGFRRIPLPRTPVNKAVASRFRARVPAKTTPLPAGGVARRSRRGVCWWDATRLRPPPAGVPRCAGPLRAIAPASP